MTSNGPGGHVEAPAGGSRREKVGGTADSPAAKIAKGMDELSLEQALKDVDVANARVIDLTQRLIAAQQRTVELQTTVERMQVELIELRTRYNQMRNSRAFRMADRYWRVLGALRQ
jgi:hypothetical protein